MNRGVALFVGILILIFLGFLLILTGGNGKKTPSNAPAPMSLPDYATTDATVSFTTNGIVNGVDVHRAIRITVGQDQRELDILQGYSGQVLSSQTFANTTDAYKAFLTAINNAGFLAKIKKPLVPDSPVGQCPTGFTYVLQLNQEGDTLSNTWGSTCGAKVGNSAALISTTQQLFQNQITNYFTLTGSVNLSATTTPTQ